MQTVKLCDDRAAWDTAVQRLNGHPLQLWGWGELKAQHNWRAERWLIHDNIEVIGAVQILYRRLPWPFRELAYAPRGPVMSMGRESDVYEAIADYARKGKALLLTVEPDAEIGPIGKGWRVSTNRILMAETLILDLTKTEDELLAAMNKKTRQYIRKSGSEPLTVRQITEKKDIDAALDIYRETADRAHFALHETAYYHDVQTKLSDASVLYGCYEGSTMVAFLWLAQSTATAFELYGGVNERGQELRANYMLKWHAIQHAKAAGATRYDMNGLVSEGVGNFKTGWAAHTDQLAGTFDLPLSPLYTVWAKGFPLLKQVARIVKR